jgi:hypothetical protein
MGDAVFGGGGVVVVLVAFMVRAVRASEIRIERRLELT